MPFDNAATVRVPELNMGDAPMEIRIHQCGVRRDEFGERARYAYVVLENDVPAIAGDDLCGPANGLWPEAADMAVTLASFLGATYECGEVTEHGASYSPAEQEWLAVHAERLSVWAADVEEQALEARY